MSTTTPPERSSPRTTPPEAWPPLVRLARGVRRPLARFLRLEASAGILLLAAAGAALLWANSAWATSYFQLWHTHVVHLRIGGLAFEPSLEWVVNDGLMTLFFFVVGLEIRHEVHVGELSAWRRAALPVAAAAGGMLVPAGLYLALAEEPSVRAGWGIPMATDIAFAVGILSLLGKRVPSVLRVLLLALAVIDDLGAIIVIALFYSSGVALPGLIVAALGLLGVVALRRLGVRAKLAYVAPSLVVWAGVYAAGIHPAIAGVMVGLMTPVHAERGAPSPAESLLQALHPVVTFGIMPLFALVNAGVTVAGGALDAANQSVVTAVSAGLVLGKPLGVFLASFLVLRLRIATLPAGIGLRHVVVLGVAASIGFTMSLFIAQLAFSDARLLAAAKLGVLLASGAAAALALLFGRLLLRTGELSEPARAPAEAETSPG